MSVCWQTGRDASHNASIQDRYATGEISDADLETVSGGLVQEMMASLKLMGEMLSNVSKTRSEISMTFARNARA